MSQVNRQVTKYQPGKMPESMVRDGFEEYKSAQLYFNHGNFRGHLMKRIENRKLYHKSNFHKRFFDLKYEREIILIR